MECVKRLGNYIDPTFEMTSCKVALVRIDLVGVDLMKVDLLCTHHTD